MSLDEAVSRAVNECIAEGILADFLIVFNITLKLIKE
jgi:hypothetical protein